MEYAVPEIILHIFCKDGTYANSQLFKNAISNKGSCEII